MYRVKQKPHKLSPEAPTHRRRKEETAELYKLNGTTKQKNENVKQKTDAAPQGEQKAAERNLPRLFVVGSIEKARTK